MAGSPMMINNNLFRRCVIFCYSIRMVYQIQLMRTMIFHFSHHTPISAQRTMESDGKGPWTTQHIHIGGLEAHIEELDVWWGTALEISTEIGSSELRKKFLGIIKGGCEAKKQVCTFHLDDINCTHLYTPIASHHTHPLVFPHFS